jgi:hypothetical protein
MLMAQYLPTFASSINDAGNDQGVVFHAHRNIQLLTSNVSECHRWRIHWVLAIDIPRERPVRPPQLGGMAAIPKVRGSHHHHDRCSA